MRDGEPDSKIEQIFVEQRDQIVLLAQDSTAVSALQVITMPTHLATSCASSFFESFLAPSPANSASAPV